MEEQIRQYNYRIEPREVDFLKKASIVSIGNYLLHAAGEDADKNGFGVRELNTHNASWVLTKLSVEAGRMPDEYERITVTTWVSAITRVQTTRNFEVFGNDGRRIAAGVSNWAMIDLASRRPCDLYTLDAADSMTQDVAPPVALPRRLASPQAAMKHPHKVVYSDIDFNCHTNSMKYLEWVVDLLPIEVLETRLFSRVDINFLHESRIGEELVILGDEVVRNFEIINSEGKPICRIAVELS